MWCILGMTTIYYLLFIQIHSLHPDLQGLDKLTHWYYSDIGANHNHCPIASIFCESQCLFNTQLEIWDSCFIFFICYRLKD